MQKETKSNRTRIKTPYSLDKGKIKKAIQNKKNQKEGISACSINCILAETSNFLGCFAQDELANLSIRSLPVYRIVNFDSSFSRGSHWIALRIDKKRLEVFDPLGFNSHRWPRTPHLLLDFLHKFSVNRRIYTSREIQPYSSVFCGFYCIFFVVYRSVHTFSDCTRYFSNILKKNDNILINFFNKI